MGFFKCNVDAAIFEPQNYSALAFVIHDHMGECKYAYHAAIPGITHSLMVEAIGFREVLSWLKSSQFTKVIVESDCLLFIQVLSQLHDKSSYFYNIVDNCRVLLKELSFM